MFNRAFNKRRIIALLGYPIIKKRELRDDNSVFVVMSVMLEPKIDLHPQDYLGIQIKVPVKRACVGDLVNNFVEMARKAFSDLVPVKDRKARRGDIAFISYEWIDEEIPNLRELQKVLDDDNDLVWDNECFYDLEESGDFLPGLFEALLEMPLNKEQKLFITFPSDFEVQ